MISLERRYTLIDAAVTLNGHAARVTGVREDFATVRALTVELWAVWAWETVDRIVREMGGQFHTGPIQPLGWKPGRPRAVRVIRR